MNPLYEELVNSLVEEGYLKTLEVIEAFKKTDRVDFVPEEHKSDAYVNAPLPIGFEQTISQPLTVAFMIELLEPKVGEKILEVGSGSGWQTAILASIVEQDNGEHKGKIIGMEIVPELKNIAEANVSKYGYIGKGIVNVILADGSKGYRREAPYDKIIAGAAAKGDVPAAWRNQLKIGGRIVAPVDNNVVLIDKIGKNKYVKKEHFGFNFVPLVSK